MRYRVLGPDSISGSMLGRVQVHRSVCQRSAAPESTLSSPLLITSYWALFTTRILAGGSFYLKSAESEVLRSRESSAKFSSFQNSRFSLRMTVDTAKDVFAGAMGGIAQVLIGKSSNIHFHPTAETDSWL